MAFYYKNSIENSLVKTEKKATIHGYVCNETCQLNK